MSFKRNCPFDILIKIRVFDCIMFEKWRVNLLLIFNVHYGMVLQLLVST